MAKQLQRGALAVSCAAAVFLLGPLGVYGQMPLPPAPRRSAAVTNITVDGSEAMFTTMCALLAAGFESNLSAENWHPLRARLREQMQHQQGPAVDAVRSDVTTPSLGVGDEEPPLQLATAPMSGMSKNVNWLFAIAIMSVASTHVSSRRGAACAMPT